MKFLFFVAAVIVAVSTSASTPVPGTVTAPTTIPTNTVPSSFRSTAINRINNNSQSVLELQADNQIHSLKFVYDVALHSGSVGSHDTSGSLPSGAVITNSFGYINTVFSSSGSTISIGCQNAGNIFVAATLSGSAVGVLLSGATINGHGDNFKVITAPCTIAAVSTAATHTAGKLTMFLEYFIKE